ncbi:MAG: hypothetical protein N2491_01755 [Negativicutes bacterium]|nr:hypothetical protein [Negativicutes bacterium]
MELYDFIQQHPKHHEAVLNHFGRVYRDQYPYSPADSHLWLELFIIADTVTPNKQLFERLDYIRRVGANLVRDDQFGFVVKPIIDPQGFRGWMSQEQYDIEKQCLNDFTDVLIMCLRELRKRYDTGRMIVQPTGGVR